MTVKENLEAMLADAITLRRPAAEIDKIRDSLAAYAPFDLIKTQAAQNAFLRTTL